MASNHTANFGLNQWAATDPVLREDFNADNQKIEEALETLSTDKIFIGSYVGDDTDNRTIQLAFIPRIMIVMGHIYSNGALNILTQQEGFSAYVQGFGTSSQNDVYLNEDNLIIRNRNWSNQAGKTVRYILIR